MDFELSPEQRDIQARAKALAEEVFAPKAAEIDRTEQYPWDNAKALNEAGFMGMTIPTAYGGAGKSFFEAVLAIEQIAKACAVTARIMVESNMGAISTIMKYGTEEQKRFAAAMLFERSDKPAICITEPGAGSAATEMTTEARRKGNGWVLNGMKHWITGAGVSWLHLIFARCFDEDGTELGIGGFLAVRDETEGLSIGKREPTMGLRGINEAQVIMQDMWVPADALVEPPSGLKRGFADLMDAYNSQRVGAGTIALGVAEGAYELALKYAQEREQFGRPICEFQGLQWMLVDMETAIAGAQLQIYRAAASAGEGDTMSFPDVKLAAQAKIAASEMAIKVTNEALQIYGAAGYSRDNPIERMVRDGRMFAIGGGTAQILRTVVAAKILDRKLPQTRDGYQKLAERAQKAAE